MKEICGFGNVIDNVDINRMWGNIRGNIRT
jgi:hypothetical protein